jgi:hypothetical protein
MAICEVGGKKKGKPGLMKIVSGSGSAGEEKWLDDSRFDGDDAVLVLQNAFNHEK